jgi:hypothetical protein
VEWTEEKNYMFKLSTFRERLERWIHDKQPLYPLKFNKLALIQLHELAKYGDISVSREAKRLSWGIQVRVLIGCEHVTHGWCLGARRSITDSVRLDRCIDQLSHCSRLSQSTSPLATDLSSDRQGDTSISCHLLASVTHGIES